jgi:hypothetical protein
MTFIASAVFLGILDRMMQHPAKHAPKGNAPKLNVSDKA